MSKIITKDSKPGPGVSKNEPEKRRFFLFFEIYAAKFGKLMQLNLIYTISLIPLLIGLFFSLKINPDFNNFSDLIKIQPFTIAPDFISLGILVLSLFITGPSTAGFVFVLRNMQRREHAWVLSDYWDQFKKNYKQGLAMSIIDMLVYVFLYVAFYFYTNVMPSDMPGAGNAIPVVAAGVVGAITILFTWAHFYIYTMMVTFEMKLKDIIKNSFIFAIGKLPLNLLISLIVIAIGIGCLYLFAYTILGFSLAVGLLVLSTIGFIIVFSTYPTIDANMLQKAKEQNKRVLNTRD